MIEQLLKEIRRASDALLTNGTLQSEHGNKAAGTRARKASLELERLTKAFRKESLNAEKMKKQMKDNLLKQASMFLTAVLLSIGFGSCNKPEPTPPPVSVSGVALDKASISIKVGDTETLTATVSPKNAANKKVTWKSSDSAIATVDANGKVTGVKAGEATITVTTDDGGKTATCKVTVSDKEVKVTGVKLNKTATSIFVGDSETLTATITPENATNQKVTWKSSDAAVASVDANGKVTGVRRRQDRYMQGHGQQQGGQCYGRDAQQGHAHAHRGCERDAYGHRGPCRCHQPEGNVEVEQCGCRHSRCNG